MSKSNKKKRQKQNYQNIQPKKSNTAKTKKKKPRFNKKQKIEIISFSVSCFIIIAVTIASFIYVPGIAKQTYDNTYIVQGTVTEFEYVYPTKFLGLFGYGTIQPHYIHLDNGEKYIVDGWDFKEHHGFFDPTELKNELEGEYVTLRVSKYDDYSAVTIDTNNKCYLSFEASNHQHIAAVVGITMFDLSIILIIYVAIFGLQIPPYQTYKKKYKPKKTKIK